MKKVLFALCVMALCMGASAQTKTAKPAPKAPAKPATPAKPAFALKNATDSLSYAFGISLGTYMKSQEMTNINYTAMNKAIEQTLKGQATLMDMNTANQMMGQMAEAKRAKALDAEKQKGQAFLANNKTKPGIKETATGLQYKVIAEGAGESPTAADTVVAHYRGTLIDGKEFDNSYSRGEPITIPVSGVIPGWTEALQLMKKGSKYQLFIPAALGYGDYGAGQDIPGGATLVFEVELVDIKKKG